MRELRLGLDGTRLVFPDGREMVFWFGDPNGN